MFWNINNTLTHNALFNFIVGNRGSGKTYGSKKWAIKDFIKNGNQFIYVRRYKQELKKNSKFFDDVRAEFPNNKLEVKGMTYYIDGKECGMAIPLSTAKIEKSTSFPKVNKIIFDEFILDKGAYRYLPDEVTNFLELYETIARMRDNVRVLFLANAVTQTNPYFLYFDIEMPYNSTIAKFKNNTILIELVQDEDFIKAKKRTRFGQLIDGTRYGDYAISNKFLRDNKNFIRKKNVNCKYVFTLKYQNILLGVWADYSSGHLYVSDDINKDSIIYSLTLDDHSPNTLLINRISKSSNLKMFIESYRRGLVYFENMNIKNYTYDIIKLLLTC